ncbi:MAG: DUF3570 domain-containing protein [Chromatiales bacterium]
MLFLPRRFGRWSATGPQSLMQASASSRALTAAALALPGLTPSPAHAAEGDAFSFQYGRYQESERNLFGVKSAFDPILVDSLQGSASLTLFDRLKFFANYVQDTWSGATPIATVPQGLLSGGPNCSGGNCPNPSDGVSGATPFINGELFFDSQFNPLEELFDKDGNQFFQKNGQLVDTISFASPETRKQGDFGLSYEWNEAALDVGGGLSLENDYESRWGSLGGRWDLNQKRTTLNLGLSYTASDTEALLDPDALPYIDTSAFDDQIENLPSTGDEILRGAREDWAAQFGLTQILNNNALLQTSLGYIRSTGFLENPYKVVEVAFIDPTQQFLEPLGVFTGQVQALLEQRPEVRNQWTWDARYVQYVEPLNAALHLGYRFYSDDWGIDAHTFESSWGQPVGGGWTITPWVRYYSQDAADFYQPFLISRQAFSTTVVDEETGEVIEIIPFDPKKLPANFSSDHRLSGYGALSGGLIVSKEFARGVSLEAGVEYYTHEGGLKLGGGGEGDYADFSYYQVNAALNVSLDAALPSAGGGHDSHEQVHAHGHAPAGVMFDHMLPRAGDFMVDYRYMYSRQSGDTLRGSNAASDQEIINQGCGSDVCRVTPEEMSMHMHMLELMYAPTDWLNLMLMPQFVDMDMTLRDLEGAPPPPDGTPPGHFTRHSTGGVGDTSMVALVKLFDVPGNHMHLGLGLSAPTGDVDIRLRPTHQADPEFIHYHMQLGSGTWDLLPNLTYTGARGRWSWGGQLSGIYRLEDANESGYALGDQFQATAWGSVGLTDWLSASVRGVYTTQGEINGEFDGQVGHKDREGPMDFPQNYGGRFWDVGFGLSAEIPIAGLKDNRLSVEWLQPVEDDFNGFQLERDGSLFVSFSLKF